MSLPPLLLQEERDSFKLQQFLMVVRAYTDPAQRQAASAAGGAGGSKAPQQQPKKQKKMRSGSGAAAAAAAAAAAETGLVHFLPEAECYQAAAQWSFSFAAPDRLEGKDELQPCRCVMLLSGEQVAAARKQLAALMKAAAAQQP